MNSKDVQLYPIELSLNRVKKTWGGWPGKIGEIWSLSCDPHECLVLNGILAGRSLRELVGEFQQKLLGKEVELDPREPFPFLIRFISTLRDLSIQVHPDDSYTLERGLPMVGRDKIFYILGARSDAKIYSGFSNMIDKETVLDSINKGSLLKLMNAVNVKPGEIYTVPAGRIHSIGKGVSLLEVQRHSGLTFVLSEGEEKGIKQGIELNQLDEAFKILDFNPTHPKPIPKVTIDLNNNCIEWLVITPYFMLRRLSVKKPLEISLKGTRFLVYTGLKGTGWLRWGLSDISIMIQPGQSILVPAIPEDILFKSEDNLILLETSIPELAGETIGEMIDLGIQPDRIADLGGDDYRKICKECML
jgi:mannose-6-phosphate isomerase